MLLARQIVPPATTFMLAPAAAQFGGNGPGSTSIFEMSAHRRPMRYVHSRRLIGRFLKFDVGVGCEFPVIAEADLVPGAVVRAALARQVLATNREQVVVGFNPYE